MMLLSENENLPHDYSTPVESLVLTNQNGPFDRQMDTVSKLITTKGLSLPQYRNFFDLVYNVHVW